MPSRSPEYRLLKQRMRQLKSHFLDFKFDATAALPPRRIDRVHAFRAFAHAELEAYIEDRVSAVIKAAVAEWNSKGRTTPVLTTMIAAVLTRWRDQETDGVSGQAPPSIPSISWADGGMAALIPMCEKVVLDIIKGNNGVRRRDLRKLLLPVGIPLSRLDDIWLNNLDTYGASRGEVVHRSLYAITSIPNPTDEWTTASLLVSDALVLDRLTLVLESGRYISSI